MPTIAALRSDIVTTYTDNNVGGIDGIELQATFTSVADILEEHGGLLVDTGIGLVARFIVSSAPNNPPGVPVIGTVYLIGTSPTGVWIGHANEITVWLGSVFHYVSPAEGSALYRQDNNTEYLFNGSVWELYTGVAGPTGATGSAGADGRTIHNGVGAPSDIAGVDGDFYIRTGNNSIYGPKAGGTWGSGTSLIGPQGLQGLMGLQGLQGPQGPEGPAGPGSVWGTITGTLSNQADLLSALNAKQPLDSDLTTIAGLTATTDSFLQAKSSAWETRTVSQVKTDLGLTGTNTGDETAAGILSKLLTVDGAGSGLDADLLDGNSSGAFATVAHTHVQTDVTNLVSDLAAKQPLDADLTTIAGLSATTDNFLQAKGSAWASRTVAQVKTDLSLTGVNSGDQASIVGITGTLAQFNTAVTDADLARTDAANTFTGIQTFSTPIAVGSVAAMTATVGGGVPTPPNNTTTFLRGDGTFAAPTGSGDMVLASVQSNSGAKTFLDTTMLLRNVADTFNGSFVNTNTANRIYTLKDAAGTLAFISDITGTNSGTNTGDETAAGILAKLLTVDGTGSGLDADFLDGNSSAAFATVSHTHIQADVNNLVSDLAAKQPLDSDLTTISGLTATTDNFLQAKASAWTSRTVAQVKTDLGLSGTNSGDQTITLTGDVTGAGTGSFAATISANVVTYAKIQNVSATDKLLGRVTAGAGVVEEIALTAAGRALIDDVDAPAQRTTLGLGTLATQSGTFSGTSSGTNSGDQTTIVGITGTKAQFDTAVTDGNISYIGNLLTADHTGGNWQVFYTSGTGVITELALGASGTILTSAGTAAAPTFSAPATNGDMVLASVQTNSGVKTFLDTTMGLRNVANTFTGIFTNTITAARTWTLKDASGTLAFTSDITGINSGTNTGDQTITLTGDVTGSGTGSFAATIGANKVTPAQMATIATASFLGRITAATGNVEVLSAANAWTNLGVQPAANFPALTGDVTTVAGALASTIAANVVTNAKAAQMATVTIKGNNTGGTANALDLTVAQVNAMINSTVAPVFANNTSKPTTLAGYGITDAQGLDSDLTAIAGLVATTDNFIQSKASAWASRTVAQVKTDLGLTGTNSGDQTITLTGEVTGSGTGSFAATVANDAITNAKLANVATATVKGRITAATGDPEDLTGTQTTTLLDIFTSTLKGLAPLSGGGTANFLRADGTWNAPSSISQGKLEMACLGALTL